MEKPPLSALLRLLQAHDVVHESLAGEVNAIHGLAVKEALLLMHLEAAPGNRLTRVELARRIHMSPATVTRMAAPMEKIGLVSRESDSRDARLAFVVLTDAGRQRLEETLATFEKRADQLFRDRWADEEVTELSSLLGRLLAGAPADLAVPPAA